MVKSFLSAKYLKKGFLYCIGVKVENISLGNDVLKQLKVGECIEVKSEADEDFHIIACRVDEKTFKIKNFDGDVWEIKIRPMMNDF